MARLLWDETGKRLYETGTEHGVLYPMSSTGAYGKGVAWNGLIGVSVNPEGAEESPIYANNNKYLSMISAEEVKGNISAYTSPKEFAECDGSKEVIPGVFLGQQNRKGFGLVWETIVGNDTEGNDYGTKLHIVYGAKASPSERSYKTINNDPEAMELSWDFSTTPQSVEGHKATAYVSIDSKSLGSDKYKKLTDKLFGDTTGEPTLPSIEEILTLMQS